MRESVRVLVEGSRPIRRRLRAQVCGDLMEGPVNKRFGFGARRGWGRDEFRDVGLRLDENARPRRIPRQRIPLRPSLRPEVGQRPRLELDAEFLEKRLVAIRGGLRIHGADFQSFVFSTIAISTLWAGTRKVALAVYPRYRLYSYGQISP